MQETDSNLSIIVPAYNSAQTLDACINALLRACQQIHRAEILVVDDGSTDDTSSIASRYNVRILRIRNNSGPAAARNLGAAHATGNVLVFVDADVAVAEDSLKRIVEHFKITPGDCALIGSYDDSPKEKNLISWYRNLLHHYVHQNAPEYATHFWTGLGALSKSVFDSLGGFDEQNFGRGCEDIELGYRLRAKGYSIAMDKALQGKHLKHWSLISMIRTDLLIRAIPWTHLLIRYKHFPSDFSLGLSQRVSVATAWLFLIVAPFIIVKPQYPFAVLISFIGVNWPFFKFLAKNGGWLLSAVCLPLHLLYNFNAGLGFLIGALNFSLTRKTQT